ncbi:MAG TPA: YHS domain-containing (seleno)protein [Saprospiraceae bacterium]|nr:YHS domain-containing (seleno)protein [Saprospiraceae bacterium]
MKFFILVSFLICGALEMVHSQSNVNNDKGQAAGGYDLVTYFQISGPQKGNDQFVAQHQGHAYYFINAGNKALFLKYPDRYLPQYGGWCAYAMGKDGTKVDVDPKTFKVIDGKLYLYYNKFFNNTLNKWNQDEAKLKAKADFNWLSKHNNK